MKKNYFLKKNSKVIKEALSYEINAGKADLSSLLASYEFARLNENQIAINFIETKIEAILNDYKNKIKKERKNEIVD